MRIGIDENNSRVRKMVANMDMFDIMNAYMSESVTMRRPNGYIIKVDNIDSLIREKERGSSIAYDKCDKTELALKKQIFNSLEKVVKPYTKEFAEKWMR